MVTLILVVTFARAASGEEAEEPEEATRAPGNHCLEENETKWVYHGILGGQYNPLGVEYTGDLGICVPFITTPGVLWDYTALEIGTLHFLSPAYLHLGGYISLAPISPLVLRVELSWLTFWPATLDRAAYFSRSGYDDEMRPSAMPPELGESASGWNLNLMAIIRTKFDIGRLGLIILNVMMMEFWNVGEADYYANLRLELVLARSDWALVNEAMVFLEIPLTSDLSLRLGAYDSLKYGIESRQINNNVGFMAMVNWPQLGRAVRNLAPFFRLGFHTHRPFDDGVVTLFLGVMMDMDLTSAARR